VVDQRFDSFEQFWPFYVRQHSQAATRRWHFIGTAGALLCIALTIMTFRWGMVLLAPLVFYGCAWYGHCFIEKNKPDTFGHPLWSIRADFRMFRLMLAGRMRRELNRLEEVKEEDVTIHIYE
jgi:hypothetical protein